MGHYDFRKDLSDAQATEWELAYLLYSRGKAAIIEKNNDKRFDLKVITTDSSEYTIELKHDMMYSRTGNLGVEFECRGKASGIDVTMADWWCFALHDGFWVIKTDKLRELIAQNRHFRIAVGGDPGSQTKMYLFRGHSLKPHMRKLV